MLKVKNICDHSFISNWLDADSTIIDLGLNHGGFSQELFSLCGCKILGVEANPALFNKISTISAFKAFNLAISDTEAGIDIFANKSTDFSIMFKDEDSSEKITVPSITLEKFLEQNDIEYVELLKIDIEGAEFPLFDSTTDKTLKNVEQITIEFHDFLDQSLTKDVRRIISRMESIGFYRKNFSLNNGDVLFINQQFHKLSLFDKLTLNIQKYGYGILRILKKNLSFN